MDEKELEQTYEAMDHGDVLNSDDLKSLFRLARLGLYWEKAVESENGKANVLCLLDLGKWAIHHGVPALDWVANNAGHKTTCSLNEVKDCFDGCDQKIRADEALAALPGEKG